MSGKLNEGGRVVLVWIIANYLGVAAIGVVSLIPFLTSIRGKLVAPLLIGLPIGIAQWLALRRIAPVSILWVLTISVGLILGLLVINSPILSEFSGFLDDESVLSSMIACSTIGLLGGLSQWILMRGYFEKSLIWLLSSATGLGFGVGLILVSDLINRSGFISIVLVVLVYSVITGLTISWLPNSDRRTEINPADAT